MKQTIRKIVELHDPGCWRALRSAEKRAWSRPPTADQILYRPDSFMPRGELPLKPAAVLVPLVDRSEGMTVLLTKRSSELKTHSGQVSFPGGKCDEGDENAIATALREAREEIGLTDDKVEIIGALEDYETVTGFAVSPVVGFVRPDIVLQPDPSEVEEAFEVPLDFILNEANQQLQSREWQGQTRHFYVFPHPDHYIWGATAAMLVRFSKLIREMS
ncbi:CoA pyrophosphatase [Emcibacter sp.]|uniref:CoA pyrophosphatase n=1 Tax=Emcibacter sp. TaxID=1979954 RepID=UPI002AA830FE|nr:CoA pyrophosphatase [Emcibacter sp.]